MFGDIDLGCMAKQQWLNCDLKVKVGELLLKEPGALKELKEGHCGWSWRAEGSEEVGSG